jgi:hypothetical protein
LMRQCTIEPAVQTPLSCARGSNLSLLAICTNVSFSRARGSNTSSPLHKRLAMALTYATGFCTP